MDAMTQKGVDKESNSMKERVAKQDGQIESLIAIYKEYEEVVDTGAGAGVGVGAVAVGVGAGAGVGAVDVVTSDSPSILSLQF